MRYSRSSSAQYLESEISQFVASLDDFWRDQPPLARACHVALGVRRRDRLAPVGARLLERVNECGARRPLADSLEHVLKAPVVGARVLAQVTEERPRHLRRVGLRDRESTEACEQFAPLAPQSNNDCL